MTNREKVIKGLEHCLEDGCRGCPYEKNCDVFDNAFSGTLVKDALELLKAHEPVKPTHSYSTYHCGMCGYLVGIDGINNVEGCKNQYCANCGRKVDWE